MGITMPVQLRELVERRVPHVAAVYLVGGWGLIQFISFIERFGVAPAWTNLTLFAWALLIPSVFLFTWNHGRPGRDAWTRTTKIGIPINIIVAIAVLTTAFAGTDLGATMHKVTVTDENGEQVERAVPKSSFRKRIALFWFDTQDDSLAWAREGAAVALSMDLLQNVFLDIRTPNYFREKLRQGGAGSGYDVPLSLKRQIAEEMHLPFFVGGTVAHTDAGYVVTTQLYETSGGLVKERTVANADLLVALDELSLLLRQDLELPSLRDTDLKDVPAAELLTTNLEALQAWGAGYGALMRDDWSSADAAMTRATTLDPTFALAHYILSQTRSMRGDAQTAMTHLAKAMQLKHRMPDRLHMLVKIESFLSQRQPDHALSVATMMVEFYPDDVLGHQVSAQLYVFRRELDKAIASLHKVMELDPQQEEVALQIGSLQENKGAFEEALKTYQDYAATNTSDAETLVKAGRVLVLLGRLNDARSTFERALLIDPAKISPKIELGMLERASGNDENGFRQLEQALVSATTPDDSLRVLGTLQLMYEGSGRMREALTTFERRTQISSRNMAPVQVLATQLGALGRMVKGGQRAQAEATLQRIRAQLTPPLDEHWRQGELIIGIEVRDTARIQRSLPIVRRIMESFGIQQMLEPLVIQAEGLVFEVRGDWNGALRSHQRLLEIEPAVMPLHRDIARALRNLGRLDEAQQSVERHLLVSPYSAESNMEAAHIRLARKDTAGARTHLERAAHVLARADAGYAPAAEVKKLMAEIGAR